MKTLSLAILENKNLATLPECIEGGALPALVSGLGPVHRAHLAAALRIRTGRPLIVVSPDDTAALTRRSLRASRACRRRCSAGRDTLSEL